MKILSFVNEWIEFPNMRFELVKQGISFRKNCKGSGYEYYSFRFFGLVWCYRMFWQPTPEWEE